jgi:hypothetical protein
LLLDKRISAQSKEDVLTEIDNALKLWEGPTATTILFTYVIPIVGAITALWGRFLPADLPSWAKIIGYISISYAFAILGSAFVVKRGLMLGGTARSAYFPGALESAGAYAEEKNVLDLFGIAMREAPIDVCVFVIALITSLLYVDMQIQITQAMNQAMTNWMSSEYLTQSQLSSTQSVYVGYGVNIITVTFTIIAWRRRITLHRG